MVVEADHHWTIIGGGGGASCWSGGVGCGDGGAVGDVAS